ncbi:MAG: hypothetical protein HKN86_05265, partial [Acidimicrobiia bacterium]|nr:hypothetical protein [Acidimicrobiia bacterium]
IMVHEASLENKLQKDKLEREFIEKLNPTLNICLPTRTKKEWKQDNKKKIAEHNKLYREQNKEKIAEINKLYNEAKKEKISCECGALVSKRNMSTHKKTAKHTKLLQNNL